LQTAFTGVNPSDTSPFIIFPLEPEEIQRLLSAAPFRWWITGGWALGLFIGRKSRPHLDTDVAVAPNDQTTASVACFARLKSESSFTLAITEPAVVLEKKAIGNEQLANENPPNLRQNQRLAAAGSQLTKGSKVTSHDADIIVAFIGAINRHDATAIADLMSEDHTFIDSMGGAVSGRKEMAAAWTAYFTMFPDFEIHVDTLLADNGTVAAFGSVSGTYNGKRGLVPENRIAMPAAWKAKVRTAR